MTTYFTSDTHIGHQNIITYCHRPFLTKDGQPDVPAMNAEIIRRWNITVKPTDLIYHLGDVCMGPKTEHKSFVDQLSGRKILILGNHDQKPAKMLALGFDEVHESLEIVIDNVKIFLHHQPLPREKWGGATYQFCGHVHDAFRRIENTINVGVDVWGFTPRTAGELLAATPTSGNIETEANKYEDRRHNR